MSSRIAVSYTGFNTCVIEEVSIDKLIHKDNITIREIEIIKGFPVFFSNELLTQSFLIEAEYKNDNLGKKKLFKLYFKTIRDEYNVGKTYLTRKNKIEYKKHIYEDERTALEVVKKHIPLLIDPNKESLFISYCESFIAWLTDVHTEKKQSSDMEKPERVFHEFIRHEKSKEIAKEIRLKFRHKLNVHQVNINTAILFHTLHDAKLIGIENRANLHKALEDYFDVKIGSIQNIRVHLDENFKLPTHFNGKKILEYKKDIGNIKNNLPVNNPK